MGFQPKLWCWGLIPLTALWLLAGFLNNDRIEADLTRRAAEQALEAGRPWASVTFAGRDATLTGVAPMSEARPAAAAAVAAVHGVRLVRDGATVLAEQKPWRWTAARDGTKVTLGGFVPSDEWKARVAGEIRGAIPGAVITDETRVARGAPPVFAAAAGYALAQLARLPDGKAELVDTVLSISGSAPSQEAYAAASGAALPAGVTGEVQVGLPIAKPYLWQAAKQDGTITLSGHAPSVAVKAALAALAAKTGDGVRVVDGTMLAAGAPAGFEAMAAAALGHLAGLRSGVAAIADASFSLSGAAPTFEASQRIPRQAEATLPAGFTMAKSEIAPPVVSPYLWSASRDVAGVTLDGLVPDEATRTALLDAARAAVPGASIADRQTLGAGAPAGFRAAAAFALAQLGRLEQAEARLTDTTLAFAGRAGSLAARNAAVAALAGAPAGYSVARQDITAPRIAPYLWSATRAGTRVTLAGHAPDAATKAALAAAASAPGVTVEDRQELGLGAPEGFGEMAATALRHLLRLESGEASLANSALSLTGRAGSAGLRDEIVNALRRLPAGYALGRLDLTAPELPPPPPPPPVAAVVPPPPPPGPLVSVPPPPPPPEPVVTEPPPPVAVAAPPHPPAAPAVPPRPPEVDACQRGLSALLLEPILFDTAEATIGPASYALLGRLAEVARSCPARVIEIGAHTDNEGTPERNQALSDRRAQAVVDFLVREGVAAASLRAVGYGESRPIAPNDTPENKQKNRRVEFTVR